MQVRQVRLIASHGYSLVELCVCVAIVGILLALALPSLERIRQRQRLEAIAATLFTDLQEARSLAVSRADTVQVRFNRHPNGTCYILHTGAAGDCQCDAGGLAVCANTDKVLKLAWIPKTNKVELRANIASFSFQARQGAVTSTGSIDVNASSGESIRHIVSIAGRVRTCTPSADMGQYPRC
ncbi:GspH/FimT family pseudopilin [Paucibacter sp. Y2R2-4]|uniref:GspH/FimT family pseudopilin n=1 Tax=Paucibacter sp. Y2R2-4 TaxID=2893553 RepID=UPI0021E362E6|nr:GspH/FimT family pseudopilin [Paucibacter sp. Y2R2-4]MCV2348476.1 GspH/FimT family pseudopilin [Paucibacter sp. Y2R2-4]